MEGHRQSEATSAWRRFLEALADRHPLVLVFEDLHWADDALLDFVDHLVDWSSGVPMLVLCTARPELLDRRRGWGGGKRNALTIALSPLADPDIARLIWSPPGTRGAAGRDTDDPPRHRGRQPALCGGVRADADRPRSPPPRRRPLAALRCSQPAGAGVGAGADRRSPGRPAGRSETACCRTVPCSGRSSGWGRSPR